MILLGCILLFGVDIRIDFDDKNMVAILSVYIFGRIRVVYSRFMLYNSNIYWKINNRPYRKLSLAEKNKQFQYITKKKITIEKLNVIAIYSDDDDAIAPLRVISIVSILSDILYVVDNDYFDIKTYSRSILPKFNDNSVKFHIFVKIKFGILSLIYNIIISKIYSRRRVKHAIG